MSGGNPRIPLSISKWEERPGVQESPSGLPRPCRATEERANEAPAVPRRRVLRGASDPEPREVMVDMFEDQHPPLPPRRRPEERVRRPHSPCRTGAQAFKTHFKRRLRLGGISGFSRQQFGRGGRTLRERHEVEQKVLCELLQWEGAEGALPRGAAGTSPRAIREAEHM